MEDDEDYVNQDEIDAINIQRHGEDEMYVNSDRYGDEEMGIRKSQRCSGEVYEEIDIKLQRYL